MFDEAKTGLIRPFFQRVSTITSAFHFSYLLSVLSLYILMLVPSANLEGEMIADAERGEARASSKVGRTKSIPDR